MKVQECVLLIFAAISFLPSPIDADNSHECQTSDDFSGSLSTNDKSDKSTSMNSDEDECKYNNIYQFYVQEPKNSQEVCLNKYAGKVLIIVNYASECSFTDKNMCSLSEIVEKYKQRGLILLVFPSNDFSQNIGGNSAARVLADEYPDFEVFSEIHVNGQAQHPLYKFLKKKLPGVCGTKDIKCNFTKFVVDRNGCPIKRYSATDSFEDMDQLVQELL